jgi:hypothetical protein
MIIASCREECDFSVPNKYRSFLHNYKVGDTIYFMSNHDDLDTMYIAKYDTIESCGQGFMAFKRKDFSYEIKHLPNNKWTGGTEMYQNGKSKELDLVLVSLSKNFDPNQKSEFSIYIHYREFGGKIENIDSLTKDEQLKSIGIKEYWTINKSNYDKTKTLPDTVIKKVFWTEKFGLTGYVYGNGDKYLIIK